MTKRSLVTLAIVLGVGIGVGAMSFGTLVMQLGETYHEMAATCALGCGMLAASLTGLVAQLGGGFRSLDKVDR